MLYEWDEDKRQSNIDQHGIDHHLTHWEPDTPPRAGRKLAPHEHRSQNYLEGNALVCEDNLDVLKELPDEYVDLIYLDPPFNSNQFYVAAFGDNGMVRAQLRDI